MIAIESVVCLSSFVADVLIVIRRLNISKIMLDYLLLFEAGFPFFRALCWRSKDIRLPEEAVIWSHSRMDRQLPRGASSYN